MKRSWLKFMACVALSSGATAFAQEPREQAFSSQTPEIVGDLDALLNAKRAAAAASNAPIASNVTVDVDFAKSSPTANDPYLQRLAAADSTNHGFLFNPNNFWATAAGGASYYSAPHLESKFGGAYGGDIGHRILGPIWFRAGAAANHISHGTQFLGVLGLEKRAYRDPSNLWGHLAFIALFDQYTDSRYDGLYLTRLRFDGSYFVNPCLSIGARYFEPLNRQNGVPLVDALGNAGTGSFQNARICSAYVNATTPLLGNIELEAGAKLDRSAFIGSATWRRPLTERISTYAFTQYVGTGTWSGGAGLEIRFGGMRRPPESQDVVRGSGGPKIDPNVLGGGNSASSASADEIHNPSSTQSTPQAVTTVSTQSQPTFTPPPAPPPPPPPPSPNGGPSAPPSPNGGPNAPPSPNGGPNAPPR